MKLSTESRDNMIDRIVLSSISQTLPQFVKKIFMKRYLAELDQVTCNSNNYSMNFSTKITISKYLCYRLTFELRVLEIYHHTNKTWRNVNVILVRCPK